MTSLRATDILKDRMYEMEFSVMKCPYCGNSDTRVIDSRPAEEGNSIRRRRSCDACRKRFTTYEKIRHSPQIIIKKDDNREQYGPGGKIER